MPTINIPPRIRFALYLIGAIALLLVAYAVDKSWAGDAEVRLVTGLVALLQLLAAAKTNLSDGGTTATVVVNETISAEATAREIARHQHRDQRGASTVTFGATALLCVIASVAVLALGAVTQILTGGR